MPEWFAPKRYGYGAGMPISWQGWLITIGFVAFMIGAALVFATRLLLLLAITIPMCFLVTFIVARTTRGGWRWRSGEKD